MRNNREYVACGYTEAAYLHLGFYSKHMGFKQSHLKNTVFFLKLYNYLIIL